MDFKLSEREELLRKSAREFAESEITPKIDAMEETGNFAVDLLKPMAKLGISRHHRSPGVRGRRPGVYGPDYRLRGDGPHLCGRCHGHAGASHGHRRTE